MATEQPNSSGPKYQVNISGKDYAWDKSTITPAEIRNLAGWGTAQTIEEVNLKDGSKILLGDDVSIELKPGHGFAKKIEFEPASVKPVGAHACGQ